MYINVYKCSIPEMYKKYINPALYSEVLYIDYNSIYKTIEYVSGDKVWYINLSTDSVIHREDGPAIIYADGTKIFYKYGNIHREDGPAIEYIDQELDHRYYLNDIWFSFEEWCEKLNKTNEEKVFLKLKYGR